MGVVAAAFTHYDSRAGDPQLHDHVVVWNRASRSRTASGGHSTPAGLYKQIVTLSELHEGVLTDILTEALGVGWDEAEDPKRDAQARDRRCPRCSDARVLAASSDYGSSERTSWSRSSCTAHGREPSPVEMRLAQQANLETRKEKQHWSLLEDDRPVAGAGR